MIDPAYIHAYRHTRILTRDNVKRWSKRDLAERHATREEYALLGTVRNSPPPPGLQWSPRADVTSVRTEGGCSVRSIASVTGFGANNRDPASLSQVLKSLEAMDLQEILAYVSDQYQSGPLTKALIRQDLATTFALDDAMKARVRVDEIRAVGDEAVIVTTGAVQGRLRLVGSWTPLLAWTHQSEVLRREPGVWRAWGDHQRG